MSRFHLEFQKPIQGTFEPRELNLALVFQVNCPGCFAYALPLMAQIYEAYQHKMGFLGVSTAFEDFELNTEDHTRTLLKTGNTVGETAKYMAQLGKSTFDTPIKFPVAFDALHEPTTYLTEARINEWAQYLPGYETWTSERKSEVVLQLKAYYSKLDYLALTFTLNGLRGTPSWVLFNKDHHLLYTDFGHVEKEMLVNKIQKFLG